MGSDPAQGPEHQMAAAFVTLADTLVSGFDIIEFLQQMAERSVELLDVDAAGLLVTDQRGQLRLMAASSEQVRLLELFQLQSEQGPCLDTFVGGRPVHCADLAGAAARTWWPLFADQARECGFSAVSALPMRLRDQVIGALNLFRTAPGPLPDRSLHIGQAMADIATIGLLQERTIRQGQVLTDQLQGALTSRVLIEQAKGVLAGRHGWTVDRAFTVLRAHARGHNQRLTDLARAVVDGSPEAGEPGVLDGLDRPSGDDR
ncbi:GAF and ANTAR domain-containing protein [Spirillospora sp. CA-253888]